MALFQKKQQAEMSAPFYSIGMEKTILIVGLGNPGSDYKDTRHNIGFEAVQTFAEKNEFPAWATKKDLKCILTSHTLGNTRVIIVKPLTFMNLSGEAVQAVQRFYKLNNGVTLVIHDELDIPFGQIRTRIGGSDAGNNGIKSIIQHCGAEFGRVRIGIKTDTPLESADFVLAKFNSEEQSQLPNLLKETSAILSEYVYGGHLPHETRSFII